MIQFYLVSVVYLVFSSFLLLVDSYRRRLSFMLKAKSRIREKPGLLNFYFILGIVIFLLLLFFPISPGPQIAGDVLPSVFSIGMAFFFRILYSERNRERSDAYLAGKKPRLKKLGFACLFVALLHFLFPSFVLL